MTTHRDDTPEVRPRGLRARCAGCGATTYFATLGDPQEALEANPAKRAERTCLERECGLSQSFARAVVARS